MKPGSPPRFLRCTALALALLSATPLLLPAAALAQTAPVPRPVALTKVDLVSQSATESHFQLTLQPSANPFQALANDPRDPALALALATRSASAVAPRGLNGLVRSIQFVQAEGVLVLHFIVNTNATITASRNGDQLVDVVVSSGSGTAQNGGYTAPAKSGGSGQFVGPPEGQEGYQLVLLKYADVSEVVGLLTDGSVKSNDVFIPQEPSFGSNSLTGNTYQPQPASQAPGTTDAPLGESINASIAIDRRLNAIWLRGSPDEIARLKAMIAMIDIPVDSVILETQMSSSRRPDRRISGSISPTPTGSSESPPSSPASSSLPESRPAITSAASSSRQRSTRRSARATAGLFPSQGSRRRAARRPRSLLAMRFRSSPRSPCRASTACRSKCNT